MSAPNTLADALLKEALTPKSHLHSRALALTLTKARKFVLDDGMSAFMATISQVPFTSVAPARRPEILDSFRHGARLPHPTTWIEFNGREFRKEIVKLSPLKADALGRPLANDPEGREAVPKWGWLLEEHPQLPQAVKLRQFFTVESGGVGEMPFHFVWQTADEPLPWTADTDVSELAHGIRGYPCKQVGVVYQGPIPKDRRIKVRRAPPYREGTVHTLSVTGEEETFVTDQLLAEVAGTTRYAVALLSTLNDVPATLTEVKADRGFMAGGNYRRYMDHNVIRLTVPTRMDTRRLARKLVALARQRNHPVRGHWRLYQRGEGDLCPPLEHLWGPADEKGHAPCTKCPAWRTWIAEHRRGDATLGYTDHDYAVTHEARP